jgi:uncharacterized protein YndB with AHSA1/START domain
MNPSTDRIEKEILLKAPRARVWRALSDSKEFGSWFGVKFDGPFSPGARMRGVIVPTTADAEVAKVQKKYEGFSFEIAVEKMEPERLFSFRWHPYAVDPSVDYSKEPATRIEFTLEPAEGGTLLRLVESGFDQIPSARREEAYRKNSGGWEAQLKNIQSYLAQSVARLR